ncbi:endo-1,4-beta-xylanase [Sodalis sp. RH16]|uniref:endo-1,4-beta-xylanase n=1 Tax=Sodalis sp. RH16 TaxID=3394331 RepID=UPI0039B5DCB8
MKKLFIFVMFFIFSNISLASQNKYIGVCFHPEKINISNDVLLKVLNKYKFNSFRTDYRWSNIETKKGVFNPPNERLDKIIVDSINKYNITPLIILGYKNDLYGPGKPISPEYLEGFSNYVTWVANRYKNDKIIYEIYNEWWHDDFKSNSSVNDKISSMNYLSLIKKASVIIKEIDPNALIIAGSMNPLDQRHIDWMNSMMGAGLLKYVDGVSIHPYSVKNPETDFIRIDRFEKELRSKYNEGRDVDIYISEMGYSDSIQGKLLASRQEQYAKEYMDLVNDRNYIKGIWWYQLINEKNVSSYESNFGLLNSDLTEKNIMKGFKNSKILNEISANK